MATDRGRALPKFGEWDTNSADMAQGFTVIFNKAREEKKVMKTNNMVANAELLSPRRKDDDYINKETNQSHQRKKKWRCFSLTPVCF